MFVTYCCFRNSNEKNKQWNCLWTIRDIVFQFWTLHSSPSFHWALNVFIGNTRIILSRFCSEYLHLQWLILEFLSMKATPLFFVLSHHCCHLVLRFADLFLALVFCSTPKLLCGSWKEENQAPIINSDCKSGLSLKSSGSQPVQMLIRL